MHKFYHALGALALLLPTLSHGAGDAGSCRYVPVAKLDVDYSSQTRRVSVTGNINGKPVRMLVDTGAYESRLLRGGADRLGLKLEPTGRYVYGVAGAAVTYRTWVDDFSLGASHTGRTVVPVLDLPAETRHEAIVGADYLLQTDMELSLADKTMQFFRASGCADTYLAYWDSNAMEIPFAGKEGGSNKPLVTVELNGVKLTAILDTGAPRTSVTRHAAELAGVRVDAPGVRQAGKSRGIGDKVLDNWSADFKRFRIGDETVNNPQLDIREDPPQGQGQVDVLLGIDFLSAHRILFAMSQNRLYMSYLGGELFGAKQQVPQASTKAP
jgi:predicted aspartyl protease